MSTVNRRGGNVGPALPVSNPTPASNTPATRGNTPAPRTPVDSMDRGGRAAGVAAPAAANGTQRASSVNIRAGSGVVAGVDVGAKGLTVDGQVVDRAAGVTQHTAGLLYEAARRLEGLDKPAFKGLSEARRETLAQQCSLFLTFDRDSTTRDGSAALKGRAAGYAVLHQLARSVPAAEVQERRGLLGQLLEAAGKEKHAGLRQQMIMGLNAFPAGLLTAAQVKQREALVAQLAPPAPPYEKWFGSSAAPEFKIRQYVMDEFWRGELAAYKAQGFTITENGDKALAVKILKDPEGKHPDVTARIELEKRDTEVFDTANDPKIHGIIYTGHSQLGAVGKISASKAPKLKGDKFIAMFACRTKQNLATLHRTFPGAHMLVSNHGTFAHDDRLVAKAFFEGIAKRSTYAAMEKSLEKAGPWEKNNYIFPHDAEQWAHADQDLDGATDVSGGRYDVLFDVDVKTRNTGSISFKPATPVGDVRALDARKVTDAVSWFNTEFFYWAEEQGNPAEKKRADRFSAEGWFKSDNPKEYVRIEKGGSEENPVWRVRVNAAYSHLDTDALAMVVTHEMARATMKETRPKEPEHTNRMRALAMTAAYVNLHVEYSDVADHLIRRFADPFEYPPTLTWPVVEKALAADGHAEASDKHIRALEKGLQYPFLEVNPTRSSLAFRTEVMAALDVLKDSKTAVGRATFEAIVSGRVKVDTLSDLTRPDFMRVRRDLLPDGVDLKVDDFIKLHDTQSGAMRAITSKLDGYMWDDRVYVTQGRPAKELAATLVHEVNHVFNNSEEKYRSQKAILVEEYRAFYSEELLRTGKTPTATRAKALKEEIIADYGLTNVTAKDVPDVPPGVMVPPR
jgi:hypothetical protein